MTDAQTVAPVAVSTPPAATINEPPPQAQSADPALDGFAKIAAERRTRQETSLGPIEVPFGTSTVKIHRSMPASFVVDVSTAETDPGAAINAIRSAIVDSDLPKFDKILHLAPDNPEGIDGKYLIDFLVTLGEFYGGVPLGD